MTHRKTPSLNVMPFGCRFQEKGGPNMDPKTKCCISFVTPTSARKGPIPPEFRIPNDRFASLRQNPGATPFNHNTIRIFSCLRFKGWGLRGPGSDPKFCGDIYRMTIITCIALISISGPTFRSHLESFGEGLESPCAPILKLPSNYARSGPEYCKSLEKVT